MAQWRLQKRCYVKLLNSKCEKLSMIDFGIQSESYDKLK